MTATTLDRSRQPIPMSPKEAGNTLRLRVLELLRTEIDFIPNPAFQARRGEGDDIVDATLRAATEAPNTPVELPAHLKRMCEAELLTREQEVALFREMNFLKFKANSLRSRLDPDAIDRGAVRKIEQLMSKAETIRDHIVKANIRLVMSIVKKFVTPQHSFDDMLSDGIFTLVQTVEKFDYDRGFRFSTYAYRSIARSAYRAVTTAQKEEARFARGAEDWAFEQEDDCDSSSMSDQIWDNLRDLTASMLNQLDRRERFIVRSRYALGAHRTVRTCQSLADKLGVSKERVRQLEQRAVRKLRMMASEHKIDDLFSAAMV